MRWGCGRPHRADPELCRGRQGPREKRETGDLGPQVCPEHLPYLGGFLQEPAQMDPLSK